MPRPIRATLNLAALVRNHSRVRSQIKEHGGKSQIWSVVKANAYGHGLARIAAALAPHTDGFALVEFEGAQALRDMGIRQPILMLEGCYSDVDLQRCVDLGLTTVVHSMAQAQALAAADLSTPVAIAVKLNTGMNRLGFNAVELHDALALLESSPQVGSLMLMTHFADADGPTGVSMPLVRLSEMTRGLSYPVSLANSAAILRYPETHADWVRPGIMLYGASPFPEVSAESLGLEPVMSLHSELLAVRDLQVGDSIGYGCAFVADKPMRVGIVACGYADGYPRHAPTGTPVMVDGIRTRTVGRVSMDKLCVDLTAVPHAATGTPVLLWGRDADHLLPADDVAVPAGTIAYELFCALAPRVQVEEINK